MDGKEILNIKRTADEGESHFTDNNTLEEYMENSFRFLREYPEAHDVRDVEYEGN